MRSIFVAISVLVVGALLFTQNVEATDYFVASKPSKARIRSKPVNGKVIKTVKKGTRLRILSRNNERDIKKLWLKVMLPNGSEGWIAARITQFVQAASGGAEPMPDTSFGEPLATEPMMDEPAAAEPMPDPEPAAAEPVEDLPSLDEGADEILLDEDIPEIEILDGE